MGRWKMGPNGGYWDGQDTGPDQMTPTMMQAAGQVAPAGAVLPAGQPVPMVEQGGITGKTGPIDLMPGADGQWSMGSHTGDFRSILEALKAQLGRGGVGGPQMLGGAVGGGGMMGAITSRVAPTAGGARMIGAPQQSLSALLQKRDPNAQMNLGAIGGAY